MISSPMLEAACWALVHVAVKSTLLLALAFAVVRWVKFEVASQRYFVWLLILVSLLSLPGLVLLSSRYGPVSWEIDWLTRQERFFQNLGKALEEGSASPEGGGGLLVQQEGDRLLGGLPVSCWILGCWLLGALGVVLNYLGRYTYLFYLVRRATSLTQEEWLTDLGAAKEEMGIAKNPRIVHSQHFAIPMVFGLFRSTLILPEEALGWPAERRRIVLKHELLHLKCWDPLLQILAQMVCALYWFNPLAWKAVHRALIERECACDDRVVTSGVSAGAYARTLLATAQGLLARSCPSRAIPGFVGPSELRVRICSLLEPRHRHRLTRGWAVSAALISAAIVGVLAALHPAPVSALTDRTIRVFYATNEQAPAIDIAVDGAVVIAGVKGHMGSSWTMSNFSLQPGDHRLEVRLSADPGRILAQQRLEVGKRQNYIAFVLGKPEQMSLRVVEDDLTLPAKGRQKVRIVHGAPGTGGFSVAIRELDYQSGKVGKELYRTPVLFFGELTAYAEFESDPWFAIEQFVEGKQIPLTPHFATQDGAVTVIVLTNNLSGS